MTEHILTDSVPYPGQPEQYAVYCSCGNYRPDPLSTSEEALAAGQDHVTTYTTAPTDVLDKAAALGTQRKYYTTQIIELDDRIGSIINGLRQRRGNNITGDEIAAILGIARRHLYGRYPAHGSVMDTVGLSLSDLRAMLMDNAEQREDCLTHVTKIDQEVTELLRDIRALPNKIRPTTQQQAKALGIHLRTLYHRYPVTPKEK